MQPSTRSSIALVVLLLILTAGCAPRTALQAPAAGDARARGARPAAEPAPTAAVPAPPLREAESLSFSTVYFGYDSADLGAEGRAALTAGARELRSRPELAVRIEGHCDERGTDAYNLALGERRAETVRRFLVGAGVPESRLRVISYGKERPAATGAGEQAWALNRRAELSATGR